MKLSRKSDYALRALFTLVEHYGQGPVSIREIAEGNDIPRRFLEQIMIDLRHLGVVESIAGRDGGFILANFVCLDFPLRNLLSRGSVSFSPHHAGHSKLHLKADGQRHPGICLHQPPGAKRRGVQFWRWDLVPLFFSLSIHYPPGRAC